jgi:hypothetical protein
VRPGASRSSEESIVGIAALALEEKVNVGIAPGKQSGPTRLGYFYHIAKGRVWEKGFVYFDISTLFMTENHKLLCQK